MLEWVEFGWSEGGLILESFIMKTHTKMEFKIFLVYFDSP
jgi:hypothetical protein